MSSGLIDENYFNIQPRDDLLAKCKKCGNKSSAKDFKIDDNLGVMVCSSCFQNSNFESKKKAKIPVEKPVEEKEEKKPESIVIYDENDVFRRDFRKEEKKVMPKVEDERIKFTCDNCGFGFKYNPIKMWPRGCPSCGRSIKSIKENLSILRL